MQSVFIKLQVVNTKENIDLEKIHYTDTIHYELENTAKLMRMLALQLFDKLHISLSFDECIALDLIACNEGICQRDLAKKILKDRANTGRILDSLEKKGFIKRFVDLKNNRLVKKMTINEDGLNLLNEITTKIKSYIDNVTTAVSKDEIKNMRDTLKLFRLNLEKVVETNI